jgi:hypothetical protein
MAARTAASFGRPKSRLAPQPIVLVLCEDSKASIAYLRDAAHHFRASMHVRVIHCGQTAPLRIVEEALRQRVRWDEIHCVIDRNGHETFDAALQLAGSRQGVFVVPSYPCFEYWLLLHFDYTRAPYTAVGGKSSCDRVIDALRQQPDMNGYNKGGLQGLFERLHRADRLSKALANAKRAEVEASAVAELNPSTQMHRLLARIESLGRLTPL